MINKEEIDSHIEKEKYTANLIQSPSQEKTETALPSSHNNEDANKKSKTDEDLQKTITRLLGKIKEYSNEAREPDKRILLEAYGLALSISKEIKNGGAKEKIEKEIIKCLEEVAWEDLCLAKDIELSNLASNRKNYEAAFENIRLRYKDSDFVDVEKSLMGIDFSFKEVITDIFDYLHEMLGGPPMQDYAVISIGSMATCMTTPYSDIEYIILVKDDASKTRHEVYFDNFADLFELLMISFGESPIYKAEAFLLEFKPYFKYLKKGTRVDEHKRPQDINRLYGLINTPAELVKKICEKIIHKPGNHLTSALLTTGFLAGNEQLYKRFDKLFHQALHTPGYLNCLRKLLSEDIRASNGFSNRLENSFLKKEDKKLIEVKDILTHFIHLARVLSIFLCGTGEESPLKANFFENIRMLQEKGYIGLEQYEKWRNLVEQLFQLRLKLQLHPENRSSQAKMQIKDLDRQYNIPNIVQSLKDITKIVDDLKDARKEVEVFDSLDEILSEENQRLIARSIEIKDLASGWDLIRRSLKVFYEKNLYIKQFFKAAPLSIGESNNYVNLSVVTNKEQIGKEDVVKKTGNSDRDNCIITQETIHNPKQPIDLKNIFAKQEDLNKVPSKILILGRAGIGKSTLCKHMAFQWQEKGFWNELFDYVFWIQLHSLNKKSYLEEKKITIAQVIKNEFFQDQKAIAVAMIEKILESKSDKVLLILDGFDEVAQHHGDKNSVVGDAIDSLLNFKNIIVTSRPYYIQGLNMDIILENIGFNDESVFEYVKYFGFETDNESKKNRLANILNANKSIFGIAHIPINLELLCGVIDGSEELSFEQSTIITMTEIYTKIAKTLFKLYLTKQKEYNLHMAETQYDVEVPFLKNFLGTLAFEAMRSNNLLIPSKTFDRVLTSLKKINPHNTPYTLSLNDVLKTGFIKSTNNKFSNDGYFEKDKDYYFIHLTFQEYFTAHYIVDSLCDPNQNERMLKFIQENKYQPKYEIVWWFVAGVLSELEDNTQLNNFFETLVCEPYDLIGYYARLQILRCLEEAQLRTNPKLTSKLINMVWELMLAVFAPVKGYSFLKWEAESRFYRYLSFSPHIANLLIKRLIAMPPLNEQTVFKKKKELIYAIKRIGVSTREARDFLIEIAKEDYSNLSDNERLDIEALKVLGELEKDESLYLLLDNVNDQIKPTDIPKRMLTIKINTHQEIDEKKLKDLRDYLNLQPLEIFTSQFEKLIPLDQGILSPLIKDFYEKSDGWLNSQEKDLNIVALAWMFCEYGQRNPEEMPNILLVLERYIASFPKSEEFYYSLLVNFFASLFKERLDLLDENRAGFFCSLFDNFSGYAFNSKHDFSDVLELFPDLIKVQPTFLERVINILNKLSIIEIETKDWLSLRCSRTITSLIKLDKEKFVALQPLLLNEMKEIDNSRQDLVGNKAKIIVYKNCVLLSNQACVDCLIKNFTDVAVTLSKDGFTLSIYAKIVIASIKGDGCEKQFLDLIVSSLDDNDAFAEQVVSILKDIALARKDLRSQVLDVLKQKFFDTNDNNLRREIFNFFKDLYKVDQSIILSEFLIKFLKHDACLSLDGASEFIHDCLATVKLSEEQVNQVLEFLIAEFSAGTSIKDTLRKKRELAPILAAMIKFYPQQRPLKQFLKLPPEKLSLVMNSLKYSSINPSELINLYDESGNDLCLMPVQNLLVSRQASAYIFNSDLRLFYDGKLIEHTFHNGSEKRFLDILDKEYKSLWSNSLGSSENDMALVEMINQNELGPTNNLRRRVEEGGREELAMINNDEGQFIPYYKNWCSKKILIAVGAVAVAAGLEVGRRYYYDKM